jgi:hypothetical protein
MDTSKPITAARIIAATDAELDTLTTRHMLSLMKKFRSFRAQWEEIEVNDNDLACERLKRKLEDRPHVPSRAESKRLRQEAAKKKV